MQALSKDILVLSIPILVKRVEGEGIVMKHPVDTCR